MHHVGRYISLILDTVTNFNKTSKECPFVPASNDNTTIEYVSAVQF